MTEQEAVEILVTKLLLKSYYDVVRKNVQDLVPKSIMHFLVNFNMIFIFKIHFFKSMLYVGMNSSLALIQRFIFPLLMC